MRKIIIFSEFSEMCKILHREIPNSLMLIGETPDKERRELICEFSEGNQKNILILSSAGQFGLNLQCADVLINYDQAWSLAKMLQREGRAHRIGQKKSVLVYNLLAKGTVDYYVKKVLHAKAELSNQVLGDTPISMEQIQEMLQYD